MDCYEEYRSEQSAQMRQRKSDHEARLKANIEAAERKFERERQNIKAPTIPDRLPMRTPPI